MFPRFFSKLKHVEPHGRIRPHWFLYILRNPVGFSKTQILYSKRKMFFRKSLRFFNSLFLISPKFSFPQDNERKKSSLLFKNHEMMFISISKVCYFALSSQEYESKNFLSNGTFFLYSMFANYVHTTSASLLTFLNVKLFFDQIVAKILECD